MPLAGALPAVERNLCSELVYGYLRAEIRIAFVLSRVLPRPQSLPTPLQHVLGLAVYGLLFQDRVPDHAAVHSAVETVRVLYGQGFAKVANGALRSVQRLGDAPRHQEFYTVEGASADSLQRLALFYSLPVWMIGHWSKHYGSEAAAHLAQRSFDRPWSALRVNAAYTDAQQLLADLLACGGAAVGQWGCAFAPGTVPNVVEGKSLVDLQLCGAVSYQSAGSQLVLEQLGLYDWGQPVWDACAGFGGKTVALLERGISVPLATDRNFQRLAGLPGQCSRLALTCPSTVLVDAANPPIAEWGGHILVDAPCSGLGVLARRPDIRRRPQQQAVEHELLQRRILDRLVALLHPGCELAYITCTLRVQENEKQIDRVMKDHPGLRLRCQWQTPNNHPWLEGMFGAVVRKE
ncbi:transcription antitermination factor NusB [Desulfovibrio sp.]|uniref:transcription antitermination factor NusB n=1 Tax=Desulfovibrio sp. TaxID=885 RepID=UPI0025BA8966|nr:transcription antitermination factor NusB [Desulfovibrio sp.]